MSKSSRRFPFTPLALAAALLAGLLPGPLAAAVPTSSQDSVEAREAGARPDSATADELVGGPVVVNGEVIPASVIKRELVYRLGMMQLQSRKIDVYINEEIRRRVGTGESAAEFEVSTESVDEKTQETLQQIREQYPDEDPEAILATNMLTPESFRSQVRQTQLFDKVFLPDDPGEWPETTVEAVRANAGQEFIDRLKETHEERMAKQAELAESDDPQAAAGQLMWKTIMRKMVMQFLDDSAQVRTASDGIPPQAAMVVNGTTIEVDEIFGRLGASLSPFEVEKTRTLVAKMAAVRQALQRSGHYLDDEAFAKAYEAHEEPYKGSPFNLEMMSLGFRKFPSMDTYKAHYRAQESFRRSIADQITEEALQAHMDRANKLMGLGQVNCEVILVSAFDFKRNRWKEDGWDAAAKRARDLAQALYESEGKRWSELLEERSEFYDPPTPKSQPMNFTPPQPKNGGRFGSCNRNELRQKLGESDFSDFLNGYSLTDHIFFTQEEGTIDGPFVGPHGYYFTRVFGSTPPTRQLDLADEKQRDLVIEDYVTVHFNEFAREALDDAQVQGL